MASAIAGAFDYLLTNLPAVVEAVDPDGVVIDGPVANSLPPEPAPVVYVGAVDPYTAVSADATRQYLTLGGFKVDEDFSIPCYIDASTNDGDQSASRRTALAVWDGIVHLISNDMTLGGLLLAGRVAIVDDIQIIQTDGEDEAEAGRRTVVTFRVHCQNHYKP